jgi:hypothetical protein
MSRNFLLAAFLVIPIVLAGCADDGVLSPPTDDATVLGGSSPAETPDLASRAPFGNPQVLPPNSTPYGRTYEEWAIEWWRWLWSAPPAVNPGLDATGENIDFGQEGPVWFLAPNYGGVNVRSATIPTGKALFVDVAAWFDSPGIGGSENVDELFASVNAAAEATSDVRLSVDGVAVPDIELFRLTAGPFDVTVPEDNMWDLFGIPTPAGTYGPSATEGWFVMLPPLSAGEHTIEIFADLGPAFGVSDVTVHLTVEGRLNGKGNPRAN